MAHYDVVTFDMGYTLVYFHPSELEIALSAYHAVGLRPDPAALRQARDAVWSEYFAQAGDKTFAPTPERDWEVEEAMVCRILEHLGFHDPSLVPRIVLATEVAFSAPGVMNPKAVGKTPQQLAHMAGIAVPGWARVLVVDLKGVGREHPLSGEKLTTVLGFMVEDGWRAGCERCIQLLKYGGDGHSLVIHARDEEVILAFGIEKPAFRIIVNSWGTMGAIGATTGVVPAMTLAPGGIGGAVISDNITTTHLMNVKRLAYEINPPPPAAYTLAPDVQQASGGAAAPASVELSNAEIEEIVRRILTQLEARR